MPNGRPEPDLLLSMVIGPLRIEGVSPVVPTAEGERVVAAARPMSLFNQLMDPAGEAGSALATPESGRVSPLATFAHPVPLRETVTARRAFTKAFGQGILTPTEIVTGAPEEIGDPGHPVASMFGAMGGVLVSFIPFIKGANMAVKGIGLLSPVTRQAFLRYPSLARVIEGSAAAGKTQLTRKGRVLAGTLAFGTFEAGAGPPTGVAERFAHGAAIGFGFEATLVGAGLAWRNFAIRRALSTGRVDADALALERQVHPGAWEEDPLRMINTLKRMGDADTQLAELAGLVGNVSQFSGLVIVPGLANPRRVARVIRTKTPTPVNFAIRPSGGGKFELMVVDRRAATRLDRVLWETREAEAFAVRGERVIRTKEDLLAVLTADTAFETGISVTTPTRAEIRAAEAAEGAVIEGQTTTAETIYDMSKLQELGIPEQLEAIVSGEAMEVRIALDMADAVFFESAVHEYVHHLVSRIASRRAQQLVEASGAGPLLGEEQVLRTALTPAEIRIEDVFGIEQGAGPIIEEFTKATEEFLARLGFSRSKVVETIAGDPYWTRHQELMARLGSLMFVDMAAAYRVAPNATRMLAQLIVDEAPKLTALLSRGPVINVAEWLAQGAREVPGVEIKRMIFEPLMAKPTPAMRAQYAREAGFKGMEVFVDGNAKEWVRRVGDNVFVTDLATGVVEQVPFARVQRRVFATMVQRSRGLDAALRESISGPPKWFGVLLEDELTGGTKRAVIDLEKYVLIRGGAEGIDAWIAANKPGLARTRRTKIGDVLDELVGEKAGILLEDNGLYTVHVVDRGSVRMTGETIYEGILGTPTAPAGADVIPISVDNALASMLREAGATERELPHLIQRGRELIGEDALKLIDPEIRAAIQRGRTATAGTIDDVATAVGSDNVEIQALENGRYRLVDPLNNVEYGEFATEQEALEFASTMSIDEVGAELVTAQVSSNVIPSRTGGGPPPRPQSTELANPAPGQTTKVGWLQNKLDAAALFAPLLTPIENFAKSVQRQGFGPAFTAIFEPAQKAILEVHRIIGEVPQLALQGRTYGQQIRLIQTLTSRVNRKRYEVVRGWVEAMSREEVEAAGGLLVRGMTAEEIAAATAIVRVGLGNDVPRLIATLRLMQNAVRSKKAFVRRITRMERQRLSPEMQETIDRIRPLADMTPESLDVLMEQLQLSPEEKFVIKILEKGISRNKDEFSTFAVSRWAAARPKGNFASGRAQWAAEHQMSNIELQLGGEMDSLFKAAFADSGISARRQLGGYWPHMRMWAEQGFGPDMPFMRRLLPNESIEWSALRFRSGELDIYDVDPVLTSYKHIRNLVMKKQFDPVLPEIRNALREMRDAGNIRIHRIMNNYIDELMGKPHASFERLNRAIATSLKVLGHQAPERFAETIVNNLVALGYGATIPFRPALILRNYWQMIQMVPPRIGFHDFFAGLEKTFTKEGFAQAKKAGAVPVGVTPIFAATEALAPTSMRFLDIRMRRLFEKGFDWYRKADDIGRAAAFHGFRNRAKRHLPDFMNGRITWEQFKQRAKINTFDPVDVAEFERMFRTDMEGALDQLGVILARETHFRYGHANHPAGWGSVYGRMFGQFGTWPVQYKDFLLQGMARGSARDKFNFLTSHVAINLSLVAAGATAGINLWSWVSFPSLNYTGGPLADIFLDSVRAVGGSPAERAMARRSLFMQFPTLDDPRSIFIPGSYFVGDIVDAFDAEGRGSILEAGGFRFFEPGEKSGLEFLIGY